MKKNLLCKWQLLIHSSFSSTFPQTGLLSFLYGVNTTCPCKLPHRMLASLQASYKYKWILPHIFLRGLKLTGILSLSQILANGHSGAGQKCAEIVISIYLNCQHVANSDGVLATQINLLLEKDLLCQDCQKEKRKRPKKLQENLNTVYVWSNFLVQD